MKKLKKKLTTFQNDNCTYAIDDEKKLMYISLSFEDLSNPEKCDDYMVVDIARYNPENSDDAIMDLIKLMSR